MRMFLTGVACVLVSGCMQANSNMAATPISDEKLYKPDCYTVDLFTKVSVEKPSSDVSDAHNQFLGSWGSGAWDGVWCHDLLISRVDTGGRVELVDMHAPYEPWHRPATAYRRIGRIDDNGILRFAYGTERHSYRIVNGRLVGERNGTMGDLQIVLRRRGEPPIPIPAPDSARIASVAVTQ